MIGLYSGSFDPITIGHLDIIERAAQLVDTLHVVVFVNLNKKGLFNYNERIEMIKLATSHINNIVIDKSDELVVKYCKDNDINIIFRGIRNSQDYENEITMARINNELNPEIETLFLPTKGELSHISSSLVRELYHYNYKYYDYIPTLVYDYIKERRL